MRTSCRTQALDVWPFIEAERVITWDRADMAKREKQSWIDRAGTSPKAA